MVFEDRKREECAMPSNPDVGEKPNNAQLERANTKHPLASEEAENSQFAKRTMYCHSPCMWRSASKLTNKQAKG